jgi:uncharacterized protein
MTAGALLLICAVVLAGALLQRVAGMGMGLVAAPLLTLLLGPVAGVTVSNMAAVVVALLVLGALRGDVDWRRYARLAPLILVGSVVGALAVRSAPTAWLDVLVGGTVLLALVATAMLGRRTALGHGGAGSVVTGLVAGFMNTTAGVAGPAMKAYALATRWEQQAFAATLQPVFLTANLASVITKTAAGAGPEPGLLPWWGWPAIAVAALCGVGLGRPVSRRLGLTTAARIAMTVAVVGAVAALLRGLLAL